MPLPLPGTVTLRSSTCSSRVETCRVGKIAWRFPAACVCVEFCARGRPRWRASREWGPHDLLDGCGTGGEHHQPVQPERHAACRWHAGQRVHEFLIDRVTLSVDTLLLIHLLLETPA